MRMWVCHFVEWACKFFEYESSAVSYVHNYFKFTTYYFQHTSGIHTTMGSGSFPGIKRPGRGADHPPPSKSRGHKRVGLYLYSPSGSQWPVIGRTWYSYMCSKFKRTSSIFSTDYFAPYNFLCSLIPFRHQQDNKVMLVITSVQTLLIPEISWGANKGIQIHELILQIGLFPAIELLYFLNSHEAPAREFKHPG
jgi:hypothetical protein